MKILAIETSCDDTALALVECTGDLTRPSFRVLADAVTTQTKLHAMFGGVVPNLAKREHAKNLPILYRKVFGISNFQLSISKQTPNSKEKIPNIDLIAVTSGPGLEPALWAGITFAKELYRYLKIENRKLKIVGANHLEGHLYSFLLAQKTEKSKYQTPISKLFPAIGLIVSGGHTTLMLLKNLKTRKKLGETRDDAVGEAFDKVARIMHLPYPGGPEIERLARNGDPSAVPFPRPMMNGTNYDFSYSGLKTSVLYHLAAVTKQKPQGLSTARFTLTEKQKSDIAASFQQAAFDVLEKKAFRVAEEFGARSILLSGGVAANQNLRARLAAAAQANGMRFLVADFSHNTDNAVMIAAAAYINFLKKKKYPLVANGAMNIR